MNTVVIKTYDSSGEAFIDATLLESRGIECAVNGDNSCSVMPYLQEMVTLSVMENKQKEALEILENPNKSE